MANSFPLVVIAHNIRSLWNVGSILRTCDAFAVSHLYLAGYTGAPPRTEISKTALGAEEWVAWSKESDPLAVITRLKADGYTILGLELADGSRTLSACKPSGPTCLIVGHEVLGIPTMILDACDAVAHIPMGGKKESLNVSVAAGIALYALRNNNP